LVDRVSAWDGEQDKVGRLARLDAIRDANERHIRMAQAMLDEVEVAIPLSASALCKSPNAVAVWVQAAIKIGVQIPWSDSQAALGMTPLA